MPPPATLARLGEAPFVIGQGVFLKFKGYDGLYHRLVTGLIDRNRFTAAGPNDHYVHKRKEIELVIDAGIRVAKPASAADHGGVIEKFAKTDFGADERAELVGDAKEVAKDEGFELADPATFPLDEPLVVAADGDRVAGRVRLTGKQPNRSRDNLVGRVWVCTGLTDDRFGYTIVPVELVASSVLEFQGSRSAMSFCKGSYHPVVECAVGEVATLIQNIRTSPIVKQNLGTETPRAAEAVSDARTLSLEVLASGARRTRDFKEAAKLFSPEEYPDWPVKGPRSTAWCSAYLSRKPSGEEHHHMWRQICRLNADQWGVGEHGRLLEIADVAAGYDGFDLTNCAFAEMLFRQVQVIEWTYAKKLQENTASTSSSAGRLDREEIAAFSGRNDKASGVMVCPEVLDHVKTIVEREAAIMKNLRKAKEEREARAKKKP